MNDLLSKLEICKDALTRDSRPTDEELDAMTLVVDVIGQRIKHEITLVDEEISTLKKSRR